jgi:hypothetical protein
MVSVPRQSLGTGKIIYGGTKNNADTQKKIICDISTQHHPVVSYGFLGSICSRGKEVWFIRAGE